jgi:hypothetical protein
MRKVLLIFLSLVLALVGWSAVCADDGFYVIPTMKGKYAPVPKTGQTVTYGTRDDGSLQKGVASPTPRFTDNGNGTVTDNLTRLIWLKNANTFGIRVWDQALIDANGLADGSPGLTDGSKAGDWRLPNVRELQSLIDYGFYNPAVPNTLGTGKWIGGDPFLNVQSSFYFSSTTHATYTSSAWTVHFSDGYVGINSKSEFYYVWCVRGGK